MKDSQLELRLLTDDEVADWPILSIAAQAVHTGGMVALFPDTASARRLAVPGNKAEPAEDLHLTLVFLGEDVTGWAEAHQTARRSGTARRARRRGRFAAVGGRNHGDLGYC